MRIGSLIKIAVALVALATLASIGLVFRWNLGTQSAVAIISDLLFAILLIAGFITWNWLFQVRAKSIIRKWAAEHGYAILHFKSPFHTGPFGFWTMSRGRVVYYVSVRDGAGLERMAWVRCGSFGGGVLFSNEIEVRWNDEPKAA
jgi:hypothetical protein